MPHAEKGDSAKGGLRYVGCKSRNDEGGRLPSNDITLCTGQSAETDCSTLTGVPLKMMSPETIYAENLWCEYTEKINKKKSKRSYRHFDDVFDFAKNSEQIRKLVADPTLKSVSQHAFIPLLKILTKTPRYRYDEDSEVFGLETKIRPISFAAHFDSYLYGFYAFALTRSYERYIMNNNFDPCVLAYRSDLDGDCNIQFAERAFSHIETFTQKYGRCTAIALDIKGYFDTIDHQLLKEKWCKVIGTAELPADQYHIFRSLTAYNYINKSSLLEHFDIRLKRTDYDKNLLTLISDHLNGPSFKQKFELLRHEQLIIRNRDKNGPLKKGIPQGSPMSSVLSNIYLIDFDQWLTNMSEWMGFHYLRYCDDLLIICQSKDASYLLEKVKEEIHEAYHLTIQTKKSEIIEFRKNSKGKIRAFDIKSPAPRQTSASNEQKFYKNLQYLGFEYNGQNIYLRPTSLSRFFRKAKGRILKTMMMAYGKRSKSTVIYKRKVKELYSHFGKRNFITYAQNAAKPSYINAAGVTRKGLNAPSINRQLAGHVGFLTREMKKMSQQFSKEKNIPLKH